jgi:2-polyprenylphenol 6-hydroxylase
VVAANAFDVLVVGGGPVGWACALAAKKALTHNGKPAARIAVIDSSATSSATLPLHSVAHSKNTAMHARMYTVAHDNLTWLAALGIAPDPARAADVRNIIVHDQNGTLALNISARDARVDRLAVVLEHDWLAAQLARVATAQSVQTMIARAVSSDLVEGTRFVELDNGQMLPASLVVIAQGAASALTEHIGIKVLRHEYSRFGIIANFQTTVAHLGAARQWFLPDQSVLALLPLPQHDGHHALSMVWSVDASRRDVLCAMDAATLCKTVSAASGVPLPAVISPAQSFSLQLARAPDPVAIRALAVGDSAHAIHPLAGQGVNLGLADAQALGRALAQVGKVGGDAGHPLLLSRYRRERYGATLALQTTTDALARIYNQEPSAFPALFVNLADTGMRVLGRVPAFRRMLSSAAN